MTESVYYFGYGSLVNRATRHPDEPSIRVTLQGWTRQWAHRAVRPWQQQGQSGQGVTALTVAQIPGAAIDGVLVPIAVHDLPQLDVREVGYGRLEIPLSDFSIHDDAPDLSADSRIIMYQSSNRQWADEQQPLIISYIHCVMRGYEQQFGAAGLQRFMRTTAGWHLPLLDDRDVPVYPRAVDLESSVMQSLDVQLSRTREQ